MKKLIVISMLLLVACDNRSEVAACIRYNNDKALDYYSRGSTNMYGAQIRFDNANAGSVIKRNCSKNINYIWRP